MRKIQIMISALLILSPLAANAAPITINFDEEVVPTSSHTQDGMTFTSISGSLFEVSSGFGGFGWNVPCCPAGPDVFDLTTGGIFDLVSIGVIHADDGDPILFEGFMGASLVASFSLSDGVEQLLTFTGFTGLDRVRVTASGTFSDPTFDGLTYSPATVPEPGTLALLGLGLAGIGFTRRRKNS